MRDDRLPAAPEMRFQKTLSWTTRTFCRNGPLLIACGWVWALLFFTPTLCAQTLFWSDRVVAVVGNTPIDLHDALIEASLSNGRTVDEKEASLWHEAVTRLIEQQIVMEEIGESLNRMTSSTLPFMVRAAGSHPTDTRDASSLRRLHTQVIHAAGGERELKFLLNALHVSDPDYETILQRRARVADFIENRFRPFVYVSPDDIQTFYDKELLPNLKGEPPSMASVEDYISEIIVARRVNEEFFSWLSRRRSELRVTLLY